MVRSEPIEGVEVPLIVRSVAIPSWSGRNGTTRIVADADSSSRRPLMVGSEPI